MSSENKRLGNGPPENPYDDNTIEPQYNDSPFWSSYAARRPKMIGTLHSCPKRTVVISRFDCILLHSFQNRVIRLWKTLPIPIRNLPTVHSFKRAVKNLDLFAFFSD